MEDIHRKEIELLFKEHYREFCLLSYSYVACMDQAQDIVQDVFVTLLIKGKSNKIKFLKAYVWKSVKNNSLKQLSRTKIFESVEKKGLVIIAEDETRNKEIDFNVYKALDKLPPKCKNIFELCIIDGLKYDSAADILGISINTVKTQMKKAYRILRHNLADLYLIVVLFFQHQ